MSAPFKTVPGAAMALLQAHVAGQYKLTRKSGSFVGQCVADPSPLSEKQLSWMETMLDRAGLPPLAGDAT